MKNLDKCLHTEENFYGGEVCICLCGCVGVVMGERFLSLWYLCIKGIVDVSQVVQSNVRHK